MRPNAEGGGLARRPGARVRGWVGDGADVWRNQFGSQCVANERTRAAPAPRLWGACLPITNSQVSQTTTDKPDGDPAALFPGPRDDVSTFWTARHGVASTSPSSSAGDIDAVDALIRPYAPNSSIDLNSAQTGATSSRS